MSCDRCGGILFASGMLLAAFAVLAQAPTVVPRIGYLSVRSGGESRDEAFRQGLRELGYVEGKNIVVEYRYAQGEPGRLRELAAELVRLKVDAIVSAGPIVTRAAKSVGGSTPIVMATDVDPVGSGFAISLAHPGGNITGLSNVAPEIIGKQMQLLREIVPKLSRVAVLGNSTQPGNSHSVEEAERAAGTLGIKVEYVDVLRPSDIEVAFRAASLGNADAVLIPTAGNLFLTHRSQIIEFAAKARLPVMYSGREYVEDGGLVTYSVSYEDLYRRAAIYVRKILNGAKPGDLPIEQPTKFELMVNVKTAKALGLAIPDSILLRADRVIE